MTYKKTIPNWLSILILSGLGISVSPHQVLTRTSEVSRALSPVLSSYEVIRMAPGEIERQVRTTGELRFRFNETDFYFNLEPHDMRAPNYRAVETGPGGVRRTLSPQPVHTFKGVLAGREDTRGRFNLTDGGVEGVVYAPEGWVYVEPLRNYLATAPVGEVVVYTESDVKPGEALKCGASLPERLQRGVNRVEALVESATPVNYVAEVATEADYEYVQALGSSEAANRDILGIMNQVEGLYQSELLLQLRVSFQHAWATEDPYVDTSKHALLNDFREYWNNNFAETQIYDLAHLWTGKTGILGGTATRGTVCRSRSVSYGLSSLLRGLRANLAKTALAAHEIGHNFGATHPNYINPPIAGCFNTIMWQSAATRSALTFCEFSRQQIASYLARNNDCLTTQPITLEPPANLTATAVSTSGIGLSWRDRSMNETGFRLQRRPTEGDEWTQVGTTAANATTFTSLGLFPDVTYRYRVQAFNESELSAFSNEAVAKTQSGQLTRTHWKIDTIAGGGVGDGGPAINAWLESPAGVAVDGAGNLYIADTDNHRIRRVDSSGTITTVAGTGEDGYHGDGGPAINALLDSPAGVAVDGAGNLYIADTDNHRIRRVDSSGTITNVSGTGEPDFSGDGGPAIAAQLNLPSGVALDSAGNLYVADTWNNRIRRIDTAGTITSIAGNGRRGFSGDGGTAVAARLYYPTGVAVDGSENVYVADASNHRIRRIDTTGTITTIAGTGEEGFSSDGGPAIAAQLNLPSGVALDRVGNLYIADTDNHRIRRVDSSGTISTFAGTGDPTGWDHTVAIESSLYLPTGVAVDDVGNVYIADTGKLRIQRVDSTGMITVISGNRGNPAENEEDGDPAVGAWLRYPAAAAVDQEGNIFVNGTLDRWIRRIDANGTITTIAGASVWVTALAVDGGNNLYFAENHQVRRVDANGTVTAIAGTGEEGFSGDGGPAVDAQLYQPADLTVDGTGNLYIADTFNHRIRRVDRSGTITTIAGTGEEEFNGDGGPAIAAQLRLPSGVALDSVGNLYIADYNNHRIRRVDPSGTIATVAGTGEFGFSGDGGPAIAARLYHPQEVAVDSSGNVYIADSYNHRIRRVDPTGIITTFAGMGSQGFSGDGGPAVTAQLNRPEGVVVDGSDNVYVLDTSNHRIRIVTLTSPASALQPPSGLTASPVSRSGVDLSWQDNSDSETGFRVQRRQGRSGNWVQAGLAAENATTFSDSGLLQGTLYRYRVQAFNDSQSSSFSNEVVAVTVGPPPTIAGFVPMNGPVGTRVTVTGTGFWGTTGVKFNGISAARFEVLSGTSIETVVPLEATSGPISVETPGGTVVSADRFTVTVGGTSSRLFVPIVLRSQGRTAGSFFTSELTLTNRGSTIADIHYTYTAFGGGSGAAMDSLEPGQQRVIPDAIAYLSGRGVPIGSGSASGTLAVDFSNLSSPSDAAVTVRVTTPVEEGRAGLAYLGLNPDGLLTGPAFITGLRQNSQDRSNVAVQNAGVAGEGSITLRVTVYSGNPASAVRSVALSDRTLPPGGFYQYNGILNTAGFDNGYVKVERVNGTAPYYTYGVINDNFNSDGSFVFPVREDSLEGTSGQTLPVIIETGAFSSELTVTNFSPVAKTVEFRFVAEAVETDDDTATFSLRLKAGEQRILPQIVDWLRQQEVAGIGAARQAFVGAAFATVAEGDMSGIVIGARTGAPDKRGGQYGLFYNGVHYGSASIESAWIYGLQQNEENRSNLALVNTGEIDDSSSTFEIDIYDGDGNSQPRTKSVTLGPRRWLQMNGILGQRRQGYVEVRKTSGSNPFVTYGVVNDGGAPGERSGDGAYLPARE